MMGYNRGIMTVRLSIKLIDVNAEGLLLVKENGRGWDLPGGGPVDNEQPLETLQRECVEELGVAPAGTPAELLILEGRSLDDTFDLRFVCYSGNLNSDPNPPVDVKAQRFRRREFESLELDGIMKLNRKTIWERVF